MPDGTCVITAELWRKVLEVSRRAAKSQTLFVCVSAGASVSNVAFTVSLEDLWTVNKSNVQYEPLL